MTASLILESLAEEFSVQPSAIQAAFEMIDAGLSAPFVGRFRRALTGGLSENQIRRLVHRREALNELDRRRGTILRALEKADGLTEEALEAIRTCTDRFELEDLFVPHRRPEPEVQLALDRGLGALADAIVKPVPRADRHGEEPREEGADEEHGEPGEHEREPEPELATAHGPRAELEPGHEDHVVAHDAAFEELAVAEAEAADVGGSAPPHGEPSSPAPEEEPAEDLTPSPVQLPTANLAGLPTRIAITPELARLCAPFVDPDRGIHTESEALAGAVRILSDRLGRNAHLRTVLRRMMRKRGVLTVRPLVDESKAGRHKPLLRLNQPLRQIQGHRLLAIRQAQKDRVLNTVVHLDPQIALPKVRAALGTHTLPAFEELLTEVARQALEVRLLPVIEADVRLELKERGDLEALRFLSQHLRQILLTPPLGRRPVAGVDVNAKGDWTLAFLDEDGGVRAAVRVETGEKDAATLGAELVPLLDEHRPWLLGVGHGKGARAGGAKLREALRAAGRTEAVTVVNEAGVSSYANSELARRELPEATVPQRMAISLGRRMQDPLAEILKVDPRHLSLGAEQALVSKANARRIYEETVESSVAYAGCDVNRAPKSVLERVPGLDAASTARLVEARERRPIASREELRAEGLLSEAQWTSAVAFLRIPGAEEYLDRTSLHPEQYPLARRIFEDSGTTIEESLGRPGATRGLRRASFDLDESTWRDLMREFTFPGRDPRPRLFIPELVAPDTDPVRLTSDRVLSGIVTNVASFGAFIDVGLRQDAMLHISEIATRYVRDARELLSVGQTVRARIKEAGGQRLTLSLKDVPPPERRGSAPERGAARGAGRPRRGGGGRGRRGEPVAIGRGAPIGSGGRRRGGGSREGGRGEAERLTRDDRIELERINQSATKDASYNPFAKFFQKQKGPEEQSG